jgi:hypothetical protein
MVDKIINYLLGASPSHFISSGDPWTRLSGGEWTI